MFLFLPAHAQFIISSLMDILIGPREQSLGMELFRLRGVTGLPDNFTIQQ